jgi:restriction endonuclease S subunit
MRKGWEIKKLGDVCNIVNGSTPLRTNKNFWEDGDFPWFTIDDIRDQGRIISYTKQKVTQTALKKLRVLPIDTILLCCTASIGEYAITKIELTTNQQFNGLVIKNKKEMCPKFLMYFSSTLKDILSNLSGKATIDFIPISRLKDIEIPNPPLSEQQEIVSILDRAFETIERAKSNAEQNLKNAKELLKSYIEDLFQNGNSKWELKTLNEISENLDSKRIPITKNVRSEGLIPYYGASGIVDYVAEYLFNEELLCVSEDGANLLARTYPIAFSISGKTWVNNHAHVLKFKDLDTQKFVEIFLNSIKLDDYVSGMAQPKLNQTMLNKIPIPYPTIVEQKSIVNKIEMLTIETKKLESIYHQKLNDLEELKKSILQKAFNGELKTSKNSA